MTNGGREAAVSVGTPVEAPQPRRIDLRNGEAVLDVFREAYPNNNSGRLSYDGVVTIGQRAHALFLDAQLAGSIPPDTTDFLSPVFGLTRKSDRLRVAKVLQDRLAERGIPVQFEINTPEIPDWLKHDAAEMMLHIARYTQRRMRFTEVRGFGTHGFLPIPNLTTLGARWTSLGVNRVGFYDAAGQPTFALGSGRSVPDIFAGRSDEQNTKYMLDPETHGEPGDTPAFANPLGFYFMKLRDATGEWTKRNAEQVIFDMEGYGNFPWRLALAQTIEAAKFYTHNLPQDLMAEFILLDEKLKRAGELDPEITFDNGKKVRFVTTQNEKGDFIHLPIRYTHNVNPDHMERIFQELEDYAHMSPGVKRIVDMASTFNAGRRLTDGWSRYSRPRLEFIDVKDVYGQPNKLDIKFASHQQLYGIGREERLEELTSVHRGFQITL